MRVARAGIGLFTLLMRASARLPAQDAVALIVDLEDETAKVARDRGEPLDLSGWTLVSEEGGQGFTFPEGIRLAPGETVTVTSGPSPHDEPPAFLRWTGRYAWSNEGDPGTLLDGQGRVVARSRPPGARTRGPQAAELMNLAGKGGRISGVREG